MVGGLRVGILTRIPSAIRAPRALSVSLPDEHPRHGVSEAITDGGATAERKINAAGDAIARLVRS